MSVIMTIHAVYVPSILPDDLPSDKPLIEIDIHTCTIKKGDEIDATIRSSFDHLERITSGYKLLKVIAHTTDLSKYPDLVVQEGI